MAVGLEQSSTSTRTRHVQESVHESTWRTIRWHFHMLWNCVAQMTTFPHHLLYIMIFLTLTSRFTLSFAFYYIVQLQNCYSAAFKWPKHGISWFTLLGKAVLGESSVRSQKRYFRRQGTAYGEMNPGKKRTGVRWDVNDQLRTNICRKRVRDSGSSEGQGTLTMTTAVVVWKSRRTRSSYYRSSESAWNEDKRRRLAKMQHHLNKLPSDHAYWFQDSRLYWLFWALVMTLAKMFRAIWSSSS